MLSQLWAILFCCINKVLVFRFKFYVAIVTKIRMLAKKVWNWYVRNAIFFVPVSVTFSCLGRSRNSSQVLYSLSVTNYNFICASPSTWSQKLLFRPPRHVSSTSFSFIDVVFLYTNVLEICPCSLMHFWFILRTQIVSEYVNLKCQDVFCSVLQCMFGFNFMNCLVGDAWKIDFTIFFRFFYSQCQPSWMKHWC